MTGFLVEPGEMKAYVEHLLRLGSDPVERANIGNNAIRHVKNLFSISNEKKSLYDIMGLSD